MAISQITLDLIGETQVNPRLVRIVCDDTFATITTAGYLNSNAAGFTFLPTDFVLMRYGTGSASAGLFQVDITAGVITLTAASDSNVITPTIANHIAVYSDTNGTLTEDAATAINGGNIQAGLSGTAGTVSSFPSAATSGKITLAAVTNSSGNFNTTISNASAVGQSQVISIPDSGATTANVILSKSGGTQHITSGNLEVDAGNVIAGISGTAGFLQSFPASANGSLKMQAVANTGNTITTISNAAMGQATVVSIPDPATATANFVIAPAALVSGNLVKASGTAGLVADVGAKIIANITDTYAGGGTSNAFTATGLASGMPVVATILTSTNSVSITKAVPGTNTLTITFSADPGANTTVNYVALTAAI